MAILKQLLVHGSSRFLNTIYANDLNVDGTTAFTDLTVTGTTNLAAGSANSASLQINSKGALYGYDAWLRINQQKHFSSGVYFGTNVVRTDGSFQVGSNGANILMNTSAATFKVPINMNGTTYKWDTSGNIVVKKMTASSGLVDDLIVTNELRTFKWDIQHIANLGGSFLVTPTLNCTANSATFTVTAISGNTITAAIKDSTAITGNSLGGTTWPADSKIKISGKIGGIVLGTCDGKLTAAMNNTAGTLNIQFTYPDQATNPLAVQTYNAANVSNLTVMLTTVGATNPIGIYMTSYDTNGFSHISLYGGTATAPTVRIGNLQGLAAINNVTPTGWGIYTNNGFFSGTIVSGSGKIGGYTLDSTSLFSGTKGNSTTSGHFTLTTGTFSRAIDGTTRSNLQMALGAKFGVANDGTLYTNGANITNISASNIKTGTLSADRIAANSIQASKLSISDLQAIGATIGGFDIDSTSIHTNDVAVTSNADNSIALSSSDFTRTINGTSRAGLRFAIGDKFGVTGDGAIYASSATISGAITATSGTIGGWTANSSYGLYTNGKTSATSTKTGILIQKDGAIYAGAYDSTKTACPFQVTSAGALTATSATITGSITATSGTIGGCTIDANGNLQVPAANITGKLTANQINVSDLKALNATIGGFTIGNTAIYNGKTSYSQTTNNGVWLGTDGIGLGKGAFYVTNAGSVYAKSGTIGGWTLSANSLTTGTWGNSNSAMLCTGTSTAKSIGGSASISGWVLTAGANFGVTKTGAIYANDVHLSGAITATSGTIGGCSIDTNGVLQVPAANITGQLTASQIDASGITIGQSQVTNLSTALGNKADATTVTTLSNKVSAVYGTSNTAVGSAAKIVTCANFELFNGALITIKFTYANTSSGTIMLNVNSKGAKNVWVANAVTAADNQLLWGAGAVITFRYDGTQFVVIGEPRLWYGTCSIGAATADKSSTITGCVICKGTTVALSMTNDNTATAPTLNISDTGVKNLYAGNGTIRPLTSNGLGWTAGSTTEFVFDGQYWRVGDTAGLARATESAKTATSYITYVNATDGIKVHNASDTTNYVQLNSNGMLVYKGGTQVAKFSDTIVLGNALKTHSEIISGGFIVKDYNQSTMTFIGTLNNTSGVAEIVEKQEIVPKEIWTDNGPIEGYGVDLSSICTQIINVEYNGSSITSQVQLYDDSTIFIKNATSSYNGKLLSVRYQTSEIIPVIRFGSENNCTSLYSGAFGQTNGVFGKCSYAFGSGCTVIGDYSFAEGTDTYSRDNSHAEGLNTRAVNTSHAEGSFTLAQNGSHAEGNTTQATGSASHAEGQDCIARGAYSHASGLGTLAISKSQTVIGEYNTRDDSGVFAFIIGNGTASDDRHSAFAIAWDGTPRGQMVQHNVGTTFTLSAGVIPGFVTNNTVVLTLTTERFLDTVSTITVSTLKGGLRGVQGFLDGSAYNTNWKTSAYTVSASKLSRRHIEIRIEKNSGNFTNLVTNSPVAFYVNPTLTLNFS